jgi:hypothetical protein
MIAVRKRLLGRRGWMILLGTLAAGVTLPAVWWITRDAGPVWAVEGEPLELLAPGTEIGDEAPKGYTMVVVKVRQRVDPSQASLLSADVRSYVSQFQSIFAARVEPPGAGGERYRLGAVAQGLGTEVAGRTRIVTTPTAQQLGVDLPFGARYVLRRLEENAGLARVEARSATFVLFIVRAIMVRDGRHRTVALRYALLLDPATGKVATFVWGIDLDGDRLQAPFGGLRLLPANLEWVIDLHVDASEFLFGVPLGNALGVPDLPAGRARFPFPDDSRPLFAESPPTRPMLERLEATLRRLVAP